MIKSSRKIEVGEVERKLVDRLIEVESKRQVGEACWNLNRTDHITGKKKINNKKTEGGMRRGVIGNSGSEEIGEIEGRGKEWEEGGERRGKERESVPFSMVKRSIEEPI